MAIYDCFMYFDEELIADIRFNTLNKYVDKFVVVEATRDHSGKPKNLNFNINNFKKFKDKIIYYVVEDIPEKVEKYKKNWSPNHIRDQFQRNAISRAIVDCESDDLILISDADEIPNLSLLEKVQIKKYALFRQTNFLYKLNLLSDNKWLGTGACYKKYLKSPQWLRNKRFLRRGFLKKFFFKTQIIENGGWHFSFLKTPERIKNKMTSYAHDELKNHADLQKIKDSINFKKSFFSDAMLKSIPIDETFPIYIRENKDLFKQWIDE